MGRRMERKRQKLVGRDKGSLTEQQTKQTVTTIILIRRKYKTKQQNAQSSSHHPMLRALPSRDYLSPSKIPHRNPA